MGVTRLRLRISMIPVAVPSGPTSGETIRAAEVFRYFSIKARRMPVMAACSRCLRSVIYYGLISMCLLVKDVPPIISYIMFDMILLKSTPFALLAYLFVELYAGHEVEIYWPDS